MKGKRQIALDTETTGFNPEMGDRMVEIGAVEMIDREVTGNNYHQYINPQRLIPDAVVSVHGITDYFVADKPFFHEIVDDFIEYVRGAELIIHNASFDVKFLNYQLKQVGKKEITEYCKVTDSLAIAKKSYPGQRNSLDALCKRLKIDNEHRVLHGALLDSEILADVYLRMTKEQYELSLNKEENKVSLNEKFKEIIEIIVIHPSERELQEHKRKMEEILN